MKNNSKAIKTEGLELMKDIPVSKLFFFEYLKGQKSEKIIIENVVTVAFGRQSKGEKIKGKFILTILCHSSGFELWKAQERMDFYIKIQEGDIIFFTQIRWKFI